MVHLLLTLAYLLFALTFLLLTLSSLPTVLHAQAIDERIEMDIERILEEFDPEEDEYDPEELIRRLLDLAAEPLNVNRASVDELLMVPGMTMGLAGAVVSHREEVKPFASIEELTAVRGVGPATLERFAPYLSVGSRAERRQDVLLNPGTWIHNSRLDAFSRYRRPLQEAAGYQLADTLGGYLGSPVHYFQRFHLRSRHLSANLTQQKNPGEQYLGLSRFNHNTFHIGLQNLGRLRQLMIGDYSVRFGQGLILHSGAGFGKGRDVIGSANTTSPGIRGHTSAQSAGAFRGLAVSYGGNVRLTGFYSNKQRTASVVNGDTIRFPVSSVSYNTLTERDRANNTGQQTAGGRIALKSSSYSAGISGYLNRFSRPVQSGTQPYQLYAFQGRKASALSLDYRVRVHSLSLFGEAARTGNGAYGMITGMELSAGPDSEIALAYRNYSRRFQSIFGGSFAELSGTPRNEEGFYIGLRHSFTETIRMSTYFDQFRFPAPRFQLRQPSSGYDWLGLIEYTPDRNTELYLMMRQKIRQQEYATSDRFGRQQRLLSDHRRIASRVHFGKQVHPNIRIRSRAEMVRVRPPGSEPEFGYLIYQDIRLQARHNLQIDARITLFETDGFEPRLYHFENDLLYVFSSIMLFDQGQRMYILFNYRPAERIQIWLKAATTIYENRNSIGSGRNRIEGNTRSVIGVQVRIRI